MQDSASRDRKARCLLFTGPPLSAQNGTDLALRSAAYPESSSRQSLVELAAASDSLRILCPHGSATTILIAVPRCITCPVN
jgi:hypothetical protein